MGFPSYILANVVDSDLIMERGWRDMAPTCPRCGSSSTKFCYYNYSLTQPRYFCKGCRRYWTKGGSLRNVPVSGGCRKSRRSQSSTLRLTHPSSNHHHNQGQFGGLSSYGGNLNNMVDSTATSPTDSETPPIDLAVVYANFLTQKPENNPPLVELSSIIQDATTIIAPSSQVVLQVQQELPSFSQPLSTIPELIMNIDQHHHHHNNVNNNDNNQVLFVTDFSRPIHHHHQHNNDVDGLGLPPLPGDYSLLLQDLEVPIRLQDLESSDSQF